MNTKSLIQQMINKFSKKMSENKEARTEIEHLVKTVNIDLSAEGYSFRLEKAEITNFKPALLDNADISIITTIESLEKLIEGTLRPMKAYITKKVIVKGNIEDIVHLKKFF